MLLLLKIFISNKIKYYLFQENNKKMYKNIKTKN